MSLVMKLPKILCAAAIAIAGVIGLIFLVDLIIGIPFGRFDWMTDTIVVIACALLLWQALETWFEL